MGEHEGLAARVWRVRERTEREACALFNGLARDLRSSRGPAELVALAERCARDELVHADHCRRIMDELDPGLDALEPDLALRLGPAHLDPGRRALFTSVALGCVTESLSTALLIEMRSHARMPAVVEGLGVILRDEVRHSRLGWAHLAHAAGNEDVTWLSPFVEGMVRSALATEQITDAPTGLDLRPFGILPPAEVARICAATVADTIEPGLRLHGLEIGGSGPASSTGA